MALLEVKGLEVYYGVIQALKGIDFESAKQTAEEFRLKYMSACNGKCSENIVKELTKQE